MVGRKRMSAESSASSIFPRTDWAELGGTGEADEARLDRLIRTYWAPLRIFLVATFPSLRDQADLLLQDFAEDKILKKGWLQRADRRRGKFRDFLKTSLRNFVLDRLNRAEFKHAAGSAGGRWRRNRPRPEAPSEAFDLTWARTVLAQTLRRMEADCKDPSADQPRRGQIWEMFRIRLLEPIFEDVPPAALRGVDCALRAALADRRLQSPPERQAHFQDAPGPGHPGIRRAGRGHGGGNPGPATVPGAPGKTGMTLKSKMA